MDVGFDKTISEEESGLIDQEEEMDESDIFA